MVSIIYVEIFRHKGEFSGTLIQFLKEQIYPSPHKHMHTNTLWRITLRVQSLFSLTCCSLRVCMSFCLCLLNCCSSCVLFSLWRGCSPSVCYIMFTMLCILCMFYSVDRLCGLFCLLRSCSLCMPPLSWGAVHPVWLCVLYSMFTELLFILFVCVLYSIITECCSPCVLLYFII